MTDPSPLLDDVFRRESAHLTAALTRLFGPARLSLVEDVVQDALLRAMQAWRLSPPRDPKAWILQVARHRAIDHLRRLEREGRLQDPVHEHGVATIESALAEDQDVANQLAMMFSLCDAKLGHDTHVTLVLRFLCGLSPAEIARAFLVDTQTIDRRLHRGRVRLRELGRLADVSDRDEIRARQPSVMQGLYLMFNEGFQGSDPEEPMHPAVCADAIRLGELLLASEATSHTEVHALVALFCFHAARLPARLDAQGVFLPLAEQDRTRWDRALIERGVRHLAASASGDHLTRWHLEAGIAAEHALAPSLEATSWVRIVGLYEQLHVRHASPIVALGRGLAIAELRGVTAGREILRALAGDRRMAAYPFYWAARAELELRGNDRRAAREYYAKAMKLARSAAERRAYERKVLRLVE